MNTNAKEKIKSFNEAYEAYSLHKDYLELINTHNLEVFQKRARFIDNALNYLPSEIREQYRKTSDYIQDTESLDIPRIKTIMATYKHRAKVKKYQETAKILDSEGEKGFFNDLKAKFPDKKNEIHAVHEKWKARSTYATYSSELLVLILGILKDFRKHLEDIKKELNGIQAPNRTQSQQALVSWVEKFGCYLLEVEGQVLQAMSERLDVIASNAFLPHQNESNSQQSYQACDPKMAHISKALSLNNNIFQPSDINKAVYIDDVIYETVKEIDALDLHIAGINHFLKKTPCEPTLSYQDLLTFAFRFTENGGKFSSHQYYKKLFSQNQNDENTNDDIVEIPLSILGHYYIKLPAQDMTASFVLLDAPEPTKILDLISKEEYEKIPKEEKGCYDTVKVLFKDLYDDEDVEVEFFEGVETIAVDMKNDDEPQNKAVYVDHLKKIAFEVLKIDQVEAKALNEIVDQFIFLDSEKMAKKQVNNEKANSSSPVSSDGCQDERDGVDEVILYSENTAEKQINNEEGYLSSPASSDNSPDALDGIDEVIVYVDNSNISNQKDKPSGDNVEGEPVGSNQVVLCLNDDAEKTSGQKDEPSDEQPVKDENDGIEAHFLKTLQNLENLEVFEDLESVEEDQERVEKNQENILAPTIEEQQPTVKDSQDYSQRENIQKFLKQQLEKMDKELDALKKSCVPNPFLRKRTEEKKEALTVQLDNLKKTQNLRTFVESLLTERAIIRKRSFFGAMFLPFSATQKELKKLKAQTPYNLEESKAALSSFIEKQYAAVSIEVKHPSKLSSAGYKAKTFEKKTALFLIQEPRSIQGAKSLGQLGDIMDQALKNEAVTQKRSLLGAASLFSSRTKKGLETIQKTYLSSPAKNPRTH